MDVDDEIFNLVDLYMGMFGGAMETGKTFKLALVGSIIQEYAYTTVQDYALWEVIENGNLWVSVPPTAQENGTSVTKMFQKIVSRLAILGVVIAQEDLNSKFLNNLPPEWNTHVVVWMNKAEIETMSIDDLYNNFKIVEQSVKKSVGASSGAQNLAFMTAPSTGSTNDVNTAKPAYEVSTVSPNVNTANLEQIYEDDLEVIDLKWQLSMLNMRAKRYNQRTGKKIFINANGTAGYDKSKVECFNCYKMGHFAKECRSSRNKEGQFRFQDNTRKHKNNEDTSSKAMLAIDGVDDSKENSDDSLVKEQVSKTQVVFEVPINVDKETTIFIADRKKVENAVKGKPQQDDTGFVPVDVKAYDWD
ncbi:ribonuclease H-like domain-containing protein [Tanacetum coccineum]|uniref:Ribonuclease H-like domain-containing protein n=1 Tax=Tanacetum coccineum TaxID=301880 RepID=A0ABQ4X4W2_9ASTR